MRNTITLQYGMILVPAADSFGGTADVNAPVAAALQAELMNLGFMLDERAFAAACAAPRPWLAAYHAEVVPFLRNRLGADRPYRPYRPFYVNFPAEVMEKGHLELFFNAFVHYLSNGTWEPPQVLRARGMAFENTSFQVLRLGTEQEFKAVFTKLVSINQSLTEQDKQAVAWFVRTYGRELKLPDVIPFKETLCLLAAEGMEVPVRTPTDVLRVAVYLSGGDVSLPAVPKLKVKETRPWWPRWLLGRTPAAQVRAAQTRDALIQDARRQAREKLKFRKFSRGQRRLLLGLLEKTGGTVPQMATEMQRHLGRWLRLGEVLHPGELTGRFPRAAEAFGILRNQRKGVRVRTFHGRVDLAFKEDWHQGVDLLAARPGELARKLDWMLREFDRGYVLDVFTRASPAVSSKVLLELFDHFKARVTEGAPRSVMLKGKRAKTKTLPPLPPLPPDLVQQVGNVILRVMRERIARLPPLGSVWIDERLKTVPVPFGMRSVNTAVRTYVRGTRVPYRAGAKVVRPFVHWYDEEGNQDLDLSVGLYDGGLVQRGHISFTRLKDDALNCCHSGDVRHRKGPCAEYVDLDVQRCLSAGLRYAVVQVFNYNGRPMHTVKDCVFGLMEREDAVAGEVFLPKTISNCMALANEGTAVVACVVDLQAGEYVWADLESDRAMATLENAAGRTAEMLRALIHNTRTSVYDLLLMHAGARGSVAADAASADLALRWEDLVTNYARVGAYMSF